MKNIFSRILSCAFIASIGVAPLTAQLQDDQSIHVFSKNGVYDLLPFTEDTRIEFESRPYLNGSNEGFYLPGDTIVVCDGLNTSTSIGLLSNRALSVSANADWLFGHVVKQPYASTQEQKLIAFWTKPNFTGKPRTAVLSVTNEEGQSAQYVVTQVANKFSFSSEEYYNGGTWDGPATLTEEYNYENYNYYYRNWLGQNDYNLQYRYYVLPSYGVALTSYPEWLTLKNFFSYDRQNDTIDYQDLYEEVNKDPYNKLSLLYGKSATNAEFDLSPNLGAAERTGEIVFTNTDGQQAVVTLKQAKMTLDKLYNNWYCVDRSGTSSIISHMSQGFGGIMMLSNITSNDMSLYMGGDPWAFDHQIDYGGERYVRSSYLWNFFYSIIGEANYIITNAATSPDKAKAQPIIAQCYALRAISYFYLAQFFQHTYLTAQDEPCVPLVLSDYETSIYSRATVKQVYAQIVADLLLAEKMLDGWQRASKDEINQEVVQGFLSRVYLVMGEWTKAADKARAARSAYRLMTLQEALESDYQDINNPEVLWGHDVTADNSLIYASFQSWLSAQSQGYGGSVGALQLIDAKLYKSIPQTDVRKSLFYASDTHDFGNFIPAYANKKFKYVSDFLGDVIYMRASELYLTEIEALNLAGRQAEAEAVFSEFIDNRNASFSGALTKSEIRKQRRIELWGEGFSYFDHRRWQMNLDKNYEGNNENPENEIPNIDWNDARWRFQLPLSVLDDVDALTAEHQNTMDRQPDSLLLDINIPEPEDVAPERNATYAFDFSSVEAINAAFSYRAMLGASHTSAQPFTTNDISTLFGQGVCALVSSPFDHEVLFTQLSGRLVTNSVHNVVGTKVQLADMRYPRVEIDAYQMQALFGMVDYPGHFDVYVSETEINTLDDLLKATHVASSKDCADYVNNYSTSSESPVAFDIPQEFCDKECYIYISNKACYNITDYEPNLGVLILDMRILYAK